MSAPARLDRLLIATKNAHKVEEFREIFAESGAAQVVLEGLTAFPDVATVDETGETFLANVSLKASGYARATGRWALADDSGLCVDALNGAPGVHSARWAESHAAGIGDEANNKLLRQQLRGIPQEERTAKFVCVLALAEPSGAIIATARGEVAGRILTAARGRGGFGYDPIFLVDEVGRTAAQLEPAEKHAISHRGRAMRRLVGQLRSVGMI